MSEIQSDAPRGLSQLLLDFENALTGERTSVEDILRALHERGFGALLFIFALPAALPLPVPPGINLIIALPLIILTFQQMIGRSNVWLPEKVKKRSVDSRKLGEMIETARPWIARLEKLVKPRLAFITQGVASRLIGVCGLIMALSVTIPIPLSNTIPSFSIALMAIGVLMRDGFAVIVGAFIGLLWVVILYSLLIYFGLEGIEMIKDFIKSMLL
ncbi:MAG: hypothetical protein CL561_10880 [Alphaproteobacteria bacterium]|nr:hypothetical protein [Alphaproteobacteria bacterium]|tara:strand:- start:364 stop:1008 length:645 start_codon:yes stop_codon:yes gene_type:complete